MATTVASAPVASRAARSGSVAPTALANVPRAQPRSIQRRGLSTRVFLNPWERQRQAGAPLNIFDTSVLFGLSPDDPKFDLTANTGDFGVSASSRLPCPKTSRS